MDPPWTADTRPRGGQVDGAKGESDVPVGASPDKEWPEGWAAEVPPGIGAAALLSQLVGTADGPADSLEARGPGVGSAPEDGLQPGPELESDAEPVTDSEPTTVAESTLVDEAGAEPAAEEISEAVAEPDIEPDQDTVAGPESQPDPEGIVALEPQLDVTPESVDTPEPKPSPQPRPETAPEPQSAAGTLPTPVASVKQPTPASSSDDASTPRKNKPHSQPGPASHPVGHRTRHRRRMAAGVGGTAAFITLAMAATLTGGGSGSHTHASQQTDALATPGGTLLPSLSPADPTSAAVEPTVADAQQINGAVNSSTPSPASASATSTAGVPPQSPTSVMNQPQPAAQNHANPTTTAPRPAVTTTTAAAAPPPTVTYTGITGWACRNNGSATFRPVGESDGSTDGWKILTGNDGTGSGCSNGFLAMPMSGDAGTDAENHSDWTFTISPVTSGTCRIQVYVPKPSSSAAYEVGGTSALYGVYNGPSVAGLGLIDTFRVDQAADRGGSVAVTVPVSQPLLRIRLHDQGVDYTSSPKLMYGVAAVRVTCTGNG